MNIRILAASALALAILVPAANAARHNMHGQQHRNLTQSVALKLAISTIAQTTT